jgi:hypothetical protein
MEEKKNKFEMLSAYVDGELNEAESFEILEMLQSDSELRQKLQKYSSISGLINLDPSDKALTSNDLLARIFRMPKSYVYGMAATILIALLVVGNNYTFDQTNNEIIANAASSQEAQDHLNNIDGALNQHVMKILAADNLNVDYLNTNLVPVGYNQDPSKPSYFSNGNNKFRLHIENNNFGLNTDVYWNVNNELVYVHPMRNGRLATIYGKIEPQEAKLFLAYIDR